MSNFSDIFKNTNLGGIAGQFASSPTKALSNMGLAGSAFTGKPPALPGIGGIGGVMTGGKSFGSAKGALGGLTGAFGGNTKSSTVPFTAGNLGISLLGALPELLTHFSNLFGSKKKKKKK